MLPRTITSYLCALILALGAPAHAERILSPEEFEAISKNQTQYFYRFGEFFGSEQFFDDRETIWMFADGSCDHGVWYPVGDLICFEYDSLDHAQCWNMIEKSDGSLAARLNGFGPENDLNLKTINQADLPCPGPDYGV